MNATTTPLLTAAPPDSSRRVGNASGPNIIWAIAGVVVCELKRRKDFYALFFLTALITLLLGSLNFFNEQGVVRSLKEICLFLIWVSSLVIAISTAARQIPGEREQRTLFPLLAKPVTRTQFVLGKFVGCWLACGLCLAVFYGFFGLVAGLREQAWPVIEYAQAMVLHWFALGVVVAMSLLGSLVFAAPSSNGTITFVVVAGILLFGQHLNKVAVQLAEPGHTLVYGLYFLIPHLEWFDVRTLLVHARGAIPWTYWFLDIFYAVGFSAFFLTATCALFRRQAVH